MRATVIPFPRRTAKAPAKAKVRQAGTVSWTLFPDDSELHRMMNRHYQRRMAEHRREMQFAAACQALKAMEPDAFDAATRIIEQLAAPVRSEHEV